MKVPYVFSVLRFIYDPVTQEFVNVGLVVYSPKTKQLQARSTQHYGRISDLFETFDGVRLRHTLRFIQDSINERGAQISEELDFKPEIGLHDVLNSILPIDDSSLQFVKAGAGITEDFDLATRKLFERYVDRYIKQNAVPKRTDDDVWRSFRLALDPKNVTKYLVPKRIVAKDFEYEFERSWKNRIWHVYEPLSFDLLDANSMADKANRWVGRATSLEDSSDDFKLHVLLGAPSDPRLDAAFRKAENLLHKMPVKHEFVRESEAPEFAVALAAEIEEHLVEP
jgi:hypothetical protein